MYIIHLINLFLKLFLKISGFGVNVKIHFNNRIPHQH